MRHTSRSVWVTVLTLVLMLFTVTVAGCSNAPTGIIIPIKGQGSNAPPADTTAKTDTAQHDTSGTAADTASKTDTASAPTDSASTDPDTSAAGDSLRYDYDAAPMTSGVAWRYRDHITVYNANTGAQVEFVINAVGNAPAADCGDSMQDEFLAPGSADGAITCTNTSNPKTPQTLKLHIAPLVNGWKSETYVSVTLQ